ncbi:hypothetical protein M8J77_006493 [Diaphorina citri]|nr:hypothetical protein M8J77_006493 [Diaphorina citri]
MKPSVLYLTHCVLTMLWVLLLLPLGHSFMLDGSQDSYAQLHKWNAALNGSLELEFKTEQPNGLILYTDDGGTYDFFEIKLVEGALRLRYNLGSGAQILTVGHDLNDGHWHSVRVKRRVEKTSLTVDNITQTRTSRGKEFRFGHVTSNSWVYIGGMPPWYNAKLTLLALPSVIFEPRFVGFIRNVIYADPHASGPRRQLAHSPPTPSLKQCIGFHCSNTSRRDVLKVKEKRSWFFLLLR